MKAPRAVPAHRRHKKVLKQTKGYRSGRRTIFKQAQNALMKAGINSYRDRRRKKRDFRRLWITRINAACREYGMSYSRFIKGLLEANIQVDRKILSEMAIHHKPVFKKLLDTAAKKG